MQKIGVATWRGLLGSLVWVVAVDAYAQNAASEDCTPTNKGAVRFLPYEELGKWIVWKDERMSLRIPATWHVVRKADESKTDDWTYVLIDDNDKELLDAVVVRGGPECFPCFCAPIEHYQYSECPPYKFWSLLFGPLEPNGDFLFSFKVASGSLRLAVHAVLPPANGDTIRHIAESARIVQPEED